MTKCFNCVPLSCIYLTIQFVRSSHRFDIDSQCRAILRTRSMHGARLPNWSRVGFGIPRGVEKDYNSFEVFDDCI